MTSTCRSAPNPEALEREANAEHLELLEVAKRIGTNRLLPARLMWDRFFESASPPGALLPKVARLTLTREAVRRREERRRSLRAGLPGLLKAINE